MRTGGNFVVPYDPTSGVIFDGFVFNGFVYNNDAPRADDQFPISCFEFVSDFELRVSCFRSHA